MVPRSGNSESTAVYRVKVCNHLGDCNSSRTTTLGPQLVELEDKELENILFEELPFPTNCSQGVTETRHDHLNDLYYSSFSICEKGENSAQDYMQVGIYLWSLAK